MFLVAESALLGLFNVCVNCVNEAQGHNNHRKRTFINIILKCDFCNNKRSWNSQPFVRSIPAENLPLSFAFSFAGAIPSQALIMFEFLKMANTNTFSICTKRHYLQPTITHFWKKNQGSYFEEVRHGPGSIEAGDGQTKLLICLLLPPSVQTNCSKPRMFSDTLQYFTKASDFVVCFSNFMAALGFLCCGHNLTLSTKTPV